MHQKQNTRFFIVSPRCVRLAARPAARAYQRSLTLWQQEPFVLFFIEVTR